METMFGGMGLQDATAYWERKDEERWRRREAIRDQMNLARAAAREEARPSLVGTPHEILSRSESEFLPPGHGPVTREQLDAAKEKHRTQEFFPRTEPLARGGLAMARRPYLVGERGPELMVPDQPGRIIPNRALQEIARAVPRARGGLVEAGGELDPYQLGSPESYGGGRRTPQPVSPDTEERITALSPDARVQGLAGGVQATSETGAYGGLGYDPTQRGFTNPVPVMRGTRVTYTGPGGEEHRTLQQANQAFNRALGPEAGGGTYDPIGAPLLRLQQAGIIAGIEAGKGPLYHAQATAAELDVKQKTADTHVATLDNYLKTIRPAIAKDTGRVTFKPANEEEALDAEAAREVARRHPVPGEGGKAGITHFQERQAIRNYLKIKNYQLPTGYDVNMYLGALSQNPEAWAEMVKEGQAKRLTPPPPPESPLYVPTMLKRGAQRALSAGATALSAGATEVIP